MTQTSMFRFNLGERVRGSFGTRAEGIVTGFRRGTTFPYCVRWDDGDDSYHAGHELLHAAAPTSTPKFKIGDRVRQGEKRGVVLYVLDADSDNPAYQVKWSDTHQGLNFGHGMYHDTAHDDTPIADEMVDEARAANAWTEQRSDKCLPSDFDGIANAMRRYGWTLRSTQYVARAGSDVVFYIFEREVQGCSMCGGKVDESGTCDYCNLPF